jgi:hypothetical protein
MQCQTVFYWLVRALPAWHLRNTPETDLAFYLAGLLGIAAARAMVMIVAPVRLCVLGK